MVDEESDDQLDPDNSEEIDPSLQSQESSAQPYQEDSFSHLPKDSEDDPEGSGSSDDVQEDDSGQQQDIPEDDTEQPDSVEKSDTEDADDDDDEDEDKDDDSSEEEKASEDDPKEASKEISEEGSEKELEKESSKQAEEEKPEVEYSKEEFKQMIEALLFAAGRSLPLEEIKSLLHTRKDDLIRQIMSELTVEFKQRDSALMLIEEDNSWKVTVRERYLPVVRNIVTETELPKTIMETLAVIAFKYPILQADLIKIRTNKAYDHLVELEKLGYITRYKFGRTKKIRLTPKFFEYFELPEDKMKAMFKNYHEIAKAIEDKERHNDDQKKEIEEKKEEFKDMKEKEKISDEEFHKDIDQRIEDAKKRIGDLEVIDEKIGDLEVYDEPLPEKKDEEEGKAQEQKEKIGDLEVVDIQEEVQESSEAAEQPSQDIVPGHDEEKLIIYKRPSVERPSPAIVEQPKGSEAAEETDKEMQDRSRQEDAAEESSKAEIMTQDKIIDIQSRKRQILERLSKDHDSPSLKKEKSGFEDAITTEGSGGFKEAHIFDNGEYPQEVRGKIEHRANELMGITDEEDILGQAEEAEDKEEDTDEQAKEARPKKDDEDTGAQESDDDNEHDPHKSDEDADEKDNDDFGEEEDSGKV